MKTNQILTAINLPICNNNTQHAKKLSLIYDHIKSISKEIINVTFEPTIMFFGQYAIDEFIKGQWQRKILIEGEKLPANILTIETLTGSYKVTLPTNNNFYTLFCSLLPNYTPSYQKNQSEVICDVLINFPGDVFNDFKNGVKFTEKTPLRPVFECVCVDIKESECNIVATNGHKLYKSESYIVENSEPMQILINAKDMKAICSKKPQFVSIEIYYKQGTTEIDYCIANDHKFTPLNERYVNYNAVMPEYSTFMEFDKKEFSNNLAIVSKSAHKVTNQVKFHLNGSIEMTAGDIDYGNEANAKMPYYSKNFDDVNIGFNSKYLNDCLNVFKGDSMQMFTEGKANRPVVFKSKETNANVLLMPQVLNVC